MRAARFLIGFILLGPVVGAHADEQHLTLADAQRIALASSPLLQADERNVGVAQSLVGQARAGYLPQVDAAVTAAGANAIDARGPGAPPPLTARITAGALNDPTVLDRVGAGVTVSQLLTDFGRTGNLVDSAKATLAAARSSHEGVRQALLLGVNEAFYRTLESEATLRVAQKTYDQRKLLLDQITLLQQNKLKSELDTEFASVNFDQARLLVLRSQSEVEQAKAQLSSLIGLPAGDAFDLVDEHYTAPPPPDAVDPLVQEALDSRPALVSLGQSLEAARKYARAQRALAYPTLSLVGAAGATPVGNDSLSRYYSAGAVNLSVPLFQGGRLDEQYEEARQRALQIEDQLRNAQLAVNKDVRTAWLDARTQFQSIGVYDKLNASAQHALELAQSRYQLGISSIVELNNAELNALTAEIDDVKARSNYNIAAARLAYVTGKL